MNFADRFYWVGELADLMGYHPDSIYRAIARGALAAQCRVRALADPCNAHSTRIK
jgi:hypothetical protein